ncbi:MAG: polysaccharide deacetylase family protein [Flavobacteriaceae bacterium]|nr:polysaccharide deacetylase family protein [Flavobacteriaceae bacterium]
MFDVVPVQSPNWWRKLMPNRRWGFPDHQGKIYLTFDDGPIPEVTPWVLDCLNEYQAKATFFCIGNNIEKHPEIFRRILEEGHQIGNHTQNHLNAFKVSSKLYLDNLNLAQETLYQQKAFTKLFRPPYGKLKRKQEKELLAKGFEIIMWSVLSKDYNPKISPEQCLSNVLEHAGSGDIIVMHDSLKAMKNLKFSLPQILSHFTSKGYSFKRID